MASRHVYLRLQHAEPALSTICLIIPVIIGAGDLVREKS